MTTNIQFSERLEQLHEQLLDVARQLERAGLKARPQLAPGWVDGQEVMNALHVSTRTLQNLRDTGVLGYTCFGKKYLYRRQEIENLLQNNYVMYKLDAVGRDTSRRTAPKKKGGKR